MQNRSANLIVIHCSATPSGQRIDRGVPGEPGYLDAAQVINSWHAVRGFKRTMEARQAFNPELPSIGYHYVIDIDGKLLSGRALSEVGAHAAMFNAHSVGICMVGGAERAGRYTRAQWGALAQLVELLCTRMKIPARPPRRMYRATEPGYNVVVGVCGHRDLSPDKNGNNLVEPFEWLKTCPGFDVSAWLDNQMKPLPVHVHALDA